MKDRARRSIRLPVEVVAAVLLLVVPFWTFLHLHAYSLFKPGALAVAAVLAATGAACGWWMHRTRSTLLRVLLMAGLILVSVDLLFDIDGYHSLMAVGLLGLTWILRTHVARIVIAMTLAYGASTLAFGPHVAKQVSGTGTVKAVGNLPPLLHLIADEHVGIEGIPLDIEGASAVKTALIAYYVEHGFRLFTRAYSQYYLTMDVIPNELNFAENPVGYAWVGGSQVPRPAPLTRNRYFERLAQAGYDIRVYQPDVIDFCAATSTPPSFCYTVPANSLIHLSALNMDWDSNGWFIAAYWVTSISSLYSRIYHLYEEQLRPALAARKIAAPHWNQTNRKLAPASALDLLQRISHDIETAAALRGTAFFGHLLLPHAPYLLDERCVAAGNLLPRSDSLTDQRSTHYPKYLPQVRCLTRQIDALLAVLESRGAGDAVVIVQGDHGARIGSRPRIDRPMTREAFANSFSTLFAIKAPGVAPGIDTAAATVKDLLNAFSGTGFMDVPVSVNPAPYVFLFTGVLSARRVSAPIPRSWLDPGS